MLSFITTGLIIKTSKTAKGQLKTFNPIEDISVPFDRNFNSILRRDHRKNLMSAATIYESVDEKSLS